MKKKTPNTPSRVITTEKQAIEYESEDKFDKVKSFFANLLLVINLMRENGDDDDEPED